MKIIFTLHWLFNFSKTPLVAIRSGFYTLDFYKVWRQTFTLLLNVFVIYFVMSLAKRTKLFPITSFRVTRQRSREYRDDCTEFIQPSGWKKYISERKFLKLIENFR